MKRRNYKVFVEIKGDSSKYCVPITTETVRAEQVYSAQKIARQAKAWLNNHFPILSIEDMEVTSICEEGRAIKNVTLIREKMQWDVLDVKGGHFYYPATQAECVVREKYLRGQTPYIKQVIY